MIMNVSYPMINPYYPIFSWFNYTRCTAPVRFVFSATYAGAQGREAERGEQIGGAGRVSRWDDGEMDGVISFKMFSKPAKWRLMERIHHLMIFYGQIWLVSYLETPAENESEVEVRDFAAIVPTKRLQKKAKGYKIPGIVLSRKQVSVVLKIIKMFQQIPRKFRPNSRKIHPNSRKKNAEPSSHPKS
jgi:hypothetical protein